MKTRYFNIISIVLFFSINYINGQNVVNFTTEEGFTNGALYNQPHWDADFQTSTWMVDASQGMVTAKQLACHRGAACKFIAFFGVC